MQQASSMQRPFERAPLWPALIALFFNEEKYLDLAMSHGMAVDLEAADLAAKYKAGTFPKPGWEEDARVLARQGREELLSAFRSSLVVLVAITFLAIASLSIAGNISPDLPVAWAKVFSAVGGFLTAWATLFALGSIWRSWDGVALHELVHPKLFKLLFLPGVFLAIVGQLW
jgi:hypothetical protein